MLLAREEAYISLVKPLLLSAGQANAFAVVSVGMTAVALHAQICNLRTIFFGWVHAWSDLLVILPL